MGFPLSRSYTTNLPIEWDDPGFLPYEEWKVRLEGNRVVSTRTSITRRRQRAKPVITDRAFAATDDAAAAFAAEVASELPRVFDTGSLADDELFVAPPSPPKPHWVRDGGCEEEGPALDSEGDALLDAVVAEPDDDDRRLAFARWALQKEAPQLRALGELALAHADLRSGSSSLDQRARAQELLERHVDEWLNGTLPYARLGFRLALLDSIVLPTHEETIATTSGSELRTALATPIARALRRLVLGPVGEVRRDGNPYVFQDDLVEAVAERPRLALRELVLGAHPSAHFPYETSVGWLPESIWEMVPNLECLVITSAIGRLGKLTLPKLKELTIDDLESDCASELGEARLPALEELSIELTLTMIERSIASLQMQSLRTLTLRVPWAPSLVAVFAVLARCRWIHQLRSLTLQIALADSRVAPTDVELVELRGLVTNLRSIETLNIQGPPLLQGTLDELKMAVPQLKWAAHEAESI